MKNKLIPLLLLILCLCINGCGNAGKKFLQADIGEIQTCIIYHGDSRKIIDIAGEEGKDFIEKFSAFLEENSSKIGTLDGSLELDFADLEKFVSENNENYYILVQFQEPRTISFEGNQKETHENCDMILFAVDEMILNWSMKESFGASMGYCDYTEEVKENFSGIYEYLESELAK